MFYHPLFLKICSSSIVSFFFLVRNGNRNFDCISSQMILNLLLSHEILEAAESKCKTSRPQIKNLVMMVVSRIRKNYSQDSCGVSLLTGGALELFFLETYYCSGKGKCLDRFSITLLVNVVLCF